MRALRSLCFGFVPPRMLLLALTIHCHLIPRGNDRMFEYTEDREDTHDHMEYMWRQ